MRELFVGDYNRCVTKRETDSLADYSSRGIVCVFDLPRHSSTLRLPKDWKAPAWAESAAAVAAVAVAALQRQLQQPAGLQQ